MKGKALFFEDRIVVPQTLRNDTLRLVHSRAHFGQTGTIAALRRSYFWMKMARDAKVYCKECLTCQKVKGANQRKQPMSEFILEDCSPGINVGIDIGTLPWSDGEYRYFLLMVDLFTRHVELAPMKDQTAATVIAAFEENWIFRGHGVPGVILSDQGPNLDGQEFRRFCKTLGIDKRHTTPYHPECDGMAERNIGTVKQVISCMLLDRNLSKGVWPSLMTEVSFYMNSMENATTQTAPHMLTYGRLPKSPTDAWCRNLKGDDVNSHGEYLGTLKKKKEELQIMAKENSDINLERVRTRHNQGKIESNIEKGAK